MRLILQLAFRNIWRQRRRNSLVMLAVVLTIGGVLVMNSLARGMEYSFLHDSVNMLRGHIKVQSHLYDDEPGAKHQIPTTVVEDALNHPLVMATSPRLRIPSVIMSERETRGMSLIGFDPELEQHSFLNDITVEGDMISQADDAFIVIGRELAETLKTELGRRLVLIFEGTQENTIEIGVQVGGIYDASSDSIENTFVLTGLRSLMVTLGSQGYSEVSVYLQDETQMETVNGDLKEKFPQLLVRTWAEMDPFLAQMYQLVGFSIYILVVIFMATLVFGLVNALVTAVLERSQEFGLLRAVGLQSRLVVVQVIVECTVIMLIGLVLGLGVGLLAYLWLEEGIDLSSYAKGIEAFGMGAKMIPRLVVEDFVVLSVASLALGLIASYFPAKRVMKTSILDAIRG